MNNPFDGSCRTLQFRAVGRQSSEADGVCPHPLGMTEHAGDEFDWRYTVSESGRVVAA
jgi:hypothetical protein